MAADWSARSSHILAARIAAGPLPIADVAERPAYRGQRRWRRPKGIPRCEEGVVPDRKP